MRQHQISDKTLLLLLKEQLHKLRSVAAQTRPELNEGNESENENVRRVTLDLYYLNAVTASAVPFIDIEAAAIDKGTVENLAARRRVLEDHLRALIDFSPAGGPTTGKARLIQHHFTTVTEIINELQERYQ